MRVRRPKPRCAACAATWPGWCAPSDSATSTATCPASWGSAPTPGTGCSARRRPKELHPFREFRGQHPAVATPGDILFHVRAARMDLCFELAAQIMSRLDGAVSTADEVHGFQYFDDRDLLGFVDGMENPVDQAAVDAAIIGAEDVAFAGGSYAIVQKYLHDLKRWNAVPVERTGKDRRPGQAQRHRARRRRETELCPQHPDDHRGRRRRAQDRARRHAVRRGRQGRVRHLFRGLCPLAAPDRADDREHVRRQATRQL